jgi:beta-carotene 3-hydroxylase
MFGMMNQYAWYTWVVFILWYSLFFFVHDLIIHQRFKYLLKQKKCILVCVVRTNASQNTGKEGGESFGMLIIKKIHSSCLKTV